MARSPLRLDDELTLELAEPFTQEHTLSSKVKWRCRNCKGYWIASYYKRLVNRTGCPYCAGQKVLAGFNDLASCFPKIAEEYATANPISADAITCGSGRKVIWDCRKCKQSYSAIVSNRTNLGKGCPYCAGRIPIRGVNDFATLRPVESAEWDYEANSSTPQEHTLFSNKRVRWRCSSDHQWEASLATRAVGKGCKRCSRKESKGEKELASFIKSIYPGLVVTNDRSVLKGLELDVLLPELNLAFEYNGVYWHGESFLNERGLTGESVHQRKIDLCENLGVTLLYVWEDDWRNEGDLVKESVQRAIETVGDIHPVLKIVSKG